MCLRDKNVSGLGNDRVKELAISLPNFSELELEIPLLVEGLDPVVVGVSHDDLILLGDCDPTCLRELALQDSEFSELAVQWYIIF